MNTGKAAGSRAPVPEPAAFVGLERADGVFFFVNVRDIRQVLVRDGRVRLVFGDGATFMTRMTLPEFNAALHEAGSRYFFDSPGEKAAGEEEESCEHPLSVADAGISVRVQPAAGHHAGALAGRHGRGRD
ncbi:hypothetical protein ACP3WT_23950 [Salmonella enterica]|uniref:hypothetical protein n=1 Tax=Salmonella enterica TaxID=28901 RepID=UPI003CEACB5F